MGSFGAPPADDFGQFDMKCHVISLLFFKLFLLLQVCGGDTLTQELVFPLQKSAECLIEKVMTEVQNRCSQIKPIAQCIPEKTLDDLMETVKKSLDCIHRNEKNYINATVSEEERSKNFLQCATESKNEIGEMIKSIDFTSTECPQDIIDKIKDIKMGECTVGGRGMTIGEGSGSTVGSSVTDMFSNATANVEATTAA